MVSTAGMSKVSVYQMATNRLSGMSATQVQQMHVPMARPVLSLKSVWKHVLRMQTADKAMGVTQQAASVDRSMIASAHLTSRFVATMKMAHSIALLTTSAAMVVLSVRLVKSSVSILKATRSVTGAKNAHHLGHKPVQRQVRVTSVVEKTFA